MFALHTCYIHHHRICFNVVFCLLDSSLQIYIFLLDVLVLGDWSQKYLPIYSMYAYLHLPYFCDNMSVNIPSMEHVGYHSISWWNGFTLPNKITVLVRFTNKDNGSDQHQPRHMVVTDLVLCEIENHQNWRSILSHRIHVWYIIPTNLPLKSTKM